MTCTVFNHCTLFEVFRLFAGFPFNFAILVISRCATLRSDGLQDMGDSVSDGMLSMFRFYTDLLLMTLSQHQLSLRVVVEVEVEVVRQ